MASQVLDKLMRSDYLVDGQPLYINIQLTHSILSQYMSRQGGAEQKLKFDDSQIRDLAAKFVSTYLSDPKTAPYIGPAIVQIAEKFTPSSVDQIKKATSRTFPQNMPSDLDAAYQKLMSADTPPEQMLAAASKFPTDNRRQLYQAASNKFMGQGNTQAARAVLAENFTDETRRPDAQQF